MTKFIYLGITIFLAAFLIKFGLNFPPRKVYLFEEMQECESYGGEYRIYKINGGYVSDCRAPKQFYFIRGERPLNYFKDKFNEEAPN